MQGVLALPETESVGVVAMPETENVVVVAQPETESDVHQDPVLHSVPFVAPIRMMLPAPGTVVLQSPIAQILTGSEEQSGAGVLKRSWSDAFVGNSAFQPTMSVTSNERIKVSVGKNISFASPIMDSSEVVFRAQQTDPVQVKGKRPRQKKQTPIVRAESGVRTRSQSKGDGFRPERFECLVPKAKKKAKKNKQMDESTNGSSVTPPIPIPVLQQLGDILEIPPKHITGEKLGAPLTVPSEQKNSSNE